MLAIPLEDHFFDIIAKAQRGLGLSDEALSNRAVIPLTTLEELKKGNVDDIALSKVATVLALGSESLLALAQARYTPEPVADFEGLAHFNSVFYDMTVNAFVVWDPSTKEAAFFDTGADGDPMLEFASSRGLRVAKIFITHIHTDHIFDLDRLLEKTKAQAWVSENEPLQGAESFAPGRIFHIGALAVETRLTSGHAVGGVSYFIRGLAKPIAIVGDSIFAGSMGGGKVSYADALRNNRKQVLTLPEETIICPGHGPLTTVGEQKWANPFFAA